MSKENISPWFTEGWPHIWLPYTQMKNAVPPLPVVDAEGCRLKLADGRELIDGIASWWSVCHGYKHPHIIASVQRQLETLPHVMFAGLAHEQAYTLAKRLAAIAPRGLNRVFFSDSGSTAVEVALKMAAQYWKNKGDGKRGKFISFRHAYHGDTMGAMSVSDPEHGMHHVYHHYMPKQYVMDIPSDEYSFAEFEAMLDGIHKTVAGVIIEPLVQCAGGFHFHSADILAEIYRIAKKYSLLFIADEIAVGFGRTGSMFACEEAGITPDILCLGKALTGGTLSLGATLAIDQVFETFLSDKYETAFMHGPTFMANPLSCAAANASLDLFEKESKLEQIEAIENQLHNDLSSLKDKDGVLDVNIKGAIGVIKLVNKDWKYMLELRRKCVEQGIWLRPFSGMFYIMPSFTITSKELSMIIGNIESLLQT